MNLQILTPTEVAEKLQREEEQRKWAVFKSQLEYFVFTSLKYTLEYIVSEQKESSLTKEMMDVKLSDYWEEYPSKTIKELLEEKGWKIFELDEISYGISVK